MTAVFYVPGVEETDLKKVIRSQQQVAAYLTKGQVAFPDSFENSADPNTLDDYEEGTWTPAVTFVTPGDLSVVYSFQAGLYTKIGRIVTISFALVTSTFTHTTASGNMKITGLPFPSSSDSSQRSYAPLLFAGINKASYTQVMAALVGASSSELLVQASGMGIGVGSVAVADAPTGGQVVLGGNVSYVG